jgi:hypothetical protein
VLRFPDSSPTGSDPIFSYWRRVAFGSLQAMESQIAIEAMALANGQSLEGIM